MPALNAAAYTDLARLSALKPAAGKDERAALKEVAQEFEALLLGQMLKAMRSASNVLSQGSYLQSSETQLYQEMLDQQLAVTMSRQKGLGLSEVLVRQLSPPSAQSPSHSPEKPAGEGRADAIGVASLKWQGAASSGAAFRSKQDFIQRLAPLAENAAAQIGLKPIWLLAQAALESGWGKSIARLAQGQSSHNLFGIKAQGWKGASAKAITTEYENGKATQQTAKFRAYPSFAHSFADYLDFLQSNPRYQNALEQTANPPQFIKALQQSGYASDPNYAEKVEKIAAQIANGFVRGD